MAFEGRSKARGEQGKSAVEKLLRDQAIVNVKFNRRMILMKLSKIVTAALIALILMVAGAYAEDQAPATPAAPAAAAAPAPAPDVTGSISLLGANRYIFRGAELSSHSAVLQPSVTINYKGFSANIWGNLDTDQTPTQGFAPSNPGQKSYNETDLTLSYTYNINKLALTGGYIYYGTQYTQQTQELFVSATYDMFAHPTIAVYRDIDAHPGTYVNLSFSQSFPVYKLANGDVTVDLSAGFGYYNVDDSGEKYSALHDGNGKAGLTIPVYKNVVVQPFVQQWFPLSGTAHHDAHLENHANPAGHIDNTFVYGLGMTLNF